MSRQNFVNTSDKFVCLPPCIVCLLQSQAIFTTRTYKHRILTLQINILFVESLVPFRGDDYFRPQTHNFTWIFLI